jgi:hypothetical protein
MYVDLHVKYPLDFNETELSIKIFEKYSHVKFNENPSRGSQDFKRRWPDGQTDKHEEANIRYSQFF